MSCLHGGTPIPAGSRRDRRYCNSKCRAFASIQRRKIGASPLPAWRRPALTSDYPTLRAAAEQARQLGKAHGWGRSTIGHTIDGLAAVLDGGPDPLHLSLVFNLSLSTASRYTEIAQRLLADQLEQHAPEQ